MLQNRYENKKEKGNGNKCLKQIIFNQAQIKKNQNAYNKQ